MRQACAVRYGVLSTRHAQIARCSFNITLSVSRSRVAFRVRERVSVRGFPSKNLEKCLSSFYHLLMKNWNYLHLANRFNLGTASWKNLLLCESIASLSTNMLSMPFSCLRQIGMHGAGHGACFTCCLSFASSSTCLTNVHVLLLLRRVLVLVILQDRPMILLSLRLYLVTEESIDTNRLSDVARERDCTACAQLLCKTHALAASNCFPSGRSRCENKCACCECIETVDDVLENMFLDFVTCSRKYTSTLCLGSA